MARASALYMTGKRLSDSEHTKTKQVIAEFDRAVKDLRDSARRLQIAADNYRERLGGNRDR